MFLALVGAPVHAERVPSVVIDVGGDLAPDQLSTLTAVFRDEVSKRSELQPVATPMPIPELMLVVGCTDPDEACVRGLARHVPAKRFYGARVLKKPEGYGVELVRRNAAGEREATVARLVKGPVETLLGMFGGMVERFLAGKGEPAVSPPIAKAVQAPLPVVAPSPQPASVVVVEPEPAASPSSGSVRALTWIALGAGLVGVGVGAYFGVSARSTQDDFDSCLGRGSTSDVMGCADLADEGRRQAMMSNVSLGVGGAALVAAGVLMYFDLRRNP